MQNAKIDCANAGRRAAQRTVYDTEVGYDSIEG
jgi:hypothetical protein